jgi:hypothetical protein
MEGFAEENLDEDCYNYGATFSEWGRLDCPQDSTSLQQFFRDALKDVGNQKYTISPDQNMLQTDSMIFEKAPKKQGQDALD